MLATILSREKFIFLASLLVRIGNSNREVPEAWKLTRGLETNLKEELSRDYHVISLQQAAIFTHEFTKSRDSFEKLRFHRAK